MKKNYASLKQYLFALTLLLATTVIIYSCKKDKHNDLSISEIENLKHLYKTMNTNNLNTNLLASLNPKWETIKESKIGDTLIYEADFDNPKGVFISRYDINPEQGKELFSKNLFKLLFIKNLKNNVTKGYYMSIISDNKIDLHDMHFRNVGEFSGDINFYSLNGTFLNGWKYQHGKTTTFRRIKNTQKTLQMGIGPDKFSQSCSIFGYPVYATICFEREGSYEACFPKLTGYSYSISCSGAGGGQYEEVDVEPVDGSPDPYVDCNGNVNGSAIEIPNCGCIGGTTGLESCEQREIIDSVKNQCIKAQLANALSAKTTIRNMLNETFGGTVQFESLNLTFTDVTTLPDNISGDAGRASATSIYFDIRLNANKLPGYSQEYILSTIYHEILHAYMFSKLTMGSDGKYNISTQHEDMANKYLILMTGALKIAFPNISSQDAWALSWGGLEGTNLYTSKLTQEQRDAINEVNGKYMNKSTSPKQGTYCN
ncbi:hypothetical protein [Pedobacter kyonggii]|uniref:SprT-like domain-containing protein n=1 Tax=Pedobacter kyonggii TaxID=1926871 RepID=A0A4Q9HAN6_9SPHI|nr:hypothetical protein [Pedobacter kyonggii]TBO41125.1 hypothetical protein EYS08_15270 [Pedobacter kyonggii]